MATTTEEVIQADEWDTPTDGQLSTRRLCPKCKQMQAVVWHAYGQYWGCLYSACGWHRTPKVMTLDSLKEENRILKKRLACSLANNLCPDHRDKQKGKPCLACTIETLEKQVERLQRKGQL
jgi:hypothetical protein